LVLSGNTLYGTAETGGNGYVGTLFKVGANGADFQPRHVFQSVSLVVSNNQDFNTNGDGAFPFAGMIIANGALYGTAIYGGSQGDGVVFKVNSDGTGFTNLHSFTEYFPPNYTNSDGAAVFAGLVLSGNTLYGAAERGGTNGSGTVFALNTNGTGFTNLHSFAGPSDGASPDGALILSGNTLYGTAVSGGSGGHGTVFALNTNGTGFTVLHHFTAFNNNTNSDGAGPLAGLALSADGTTLYGTAYYGGTSGYGAVFAINTNGTGFTNLYNFTGGLDGGDPQSALAVSGNSLYGTTFLGGSSGEGTIFRLACLPPQLAINPSAANAGGTEVVLTWPASLEGFSYAGFTLQSTTNLTSGAWSGVSPLPAVINGQCIVSNAILPSQTFYRLRQDSGQ
jgi:uncharacterized repeat protein (TIGR03803 family)